MRISTELDSAAKLCGEQKAVEYIAKAGFDAWDFSMFSMCKYDWDKRLPIFTSHPLSGTEYLQFARQLKQIGLDNGIVCNQSHAPFPVNCPEIRSYLKRAIECTAEAGGNICIIHPDNDKSVQENAEMYLELLPFAKSCGVKIATENMFNWDHKENHALPAACSDPESFNAHLDAVNDDYLVACLDIGHAELFGCNTNAVDMILALGSRLQALHIHDNDLRFDSHKIPFSMKIDFNAVTKALKQINYQGYLTLEAVEYLSKGYTRDNVLEGLKNLAASAKSLSDMF